MTEKTKQILDEMGYDINDIHHAGFINSYPEKWYYVKHHKGDKIKRIWPLNHLLKDDFYDDTIVHNKYDGKDYKYNEFPINNKCYFNIENDKKYPIWYHNSIHIFLKDEYGNPKNCSTPWYIGWLTKEEMIEIVTDINKSIYYEVQ